MLKYVCPFCGATYNQIFPEPKAVCDNCGGGLGVIEVSETPKPPDGGSE